MGVMVGSKDGGMWGWLVLVISQSMTAPPPPPPPLGRLRGEVVIGAQSMSLFSSFGEIDILEITVTDNEVEVVLRVVSEV